VVGFRDVPGVGTVRGQILKHCDMRRFAGFHSATIKAVEGVE